MGKRIYSYESIKEFIEQGRDSVELLADKLDIYPDYDTQSRLENEGVMAEDPETTDEECRLYYQGFLNGVNEVLNSLEEVN